MVEWYSCYNCNKVSPLMSGKQDKCPLCGSKNGEILAGERVREMQEAGAVFNVYPSNRRRGKKRRR